MLLLFGVASHKILLPILALISLLFVLISFLFLFLLQDFELALHCRVQYYCYLISRIFQAYGSNVKKLKQDFEGKDNKEPMPVSEKSNH